MPEKTEFARPSLTARKFLNQKKFNNNMTLRGRNMKKSELNTLLFETDTISLTLFLTMVLLLKRKGGYVQAIERNIC